MKKPGRKKVLVWCLVIAAVLLFCVVNNKWLVVTEYSWEDERVQEGFRIVVVSDLHNASFGRDNSRLIKRIREQEPDLIFITGDLVDANRTDLEVGLSFCRQASQLAPCYYVTGNHERWLEDSLEQELYRGIEDSGAVILSDEVREIAVRGNRVQLCGLDDGSLADGDRLMELSKGFDRSMPVILLAHEPQCFEDYCGAEPDLVFAGHAHGGQVRLPFVGGLVAPDQGLFPEYTAGEFVSGETTMIVSRGLGNSVIPVRVFDLPEIVVCDVR